jgi:hypothetical protein
MAMKRSKLLINIGSCAYLALATCFVPTPAFSYGGPPPASAKSPGTARAQQQAQAYSGWIIRRDGDYVLVNANDETTYQLDDQHKARKYAGKSVIVIGTLNLKDDTIHVSEIRHNNS